MEDWINANKKSDLSNYLLGVKKTFAIFHL